MGNTPDGVTRPAVMSILEQMSDFIGPISFVGKMNPKTGKPFGKNAAMLTSISDNKATQNKLTGTLQKISRDMRAAAGIKNRGVTDEMVQEFADMSDDDFFTETFKLIDNALDYLYVADTRLT